MSQISDIVNVQIELNTNFTSTDSFDHICVIGQRPKKWTDWAASTAYVVGDVVVSGTHVYACETAGSSGDAAPDHTSGTAADGTVTWKYAEAKKLPFVRDPLAWALYHTWREFDDGKRCD